MPTIVGILLAEHEKSFITSGPGLSETLSVHGLILRGPIFLQEATSYEPHHEKNGFFAYAKTKGLISFAVTVKLISVFVSATRKVKFLFYLKSKISSV